MHKVTGLSESAESDTPPPLDRIQSIRPNKPCIHAHRSPPQHRLQPGAEPSRPPSSTPSFTMAGGRDAIETDSHDSSEAEALLYYTRLSTTNDGLSESAASMGARNKAPWFSHKPIADIPDGGTELARESSRDRQDLDNANLRAQGHEAALQRSFSPLAALGLGFRYNIVVLRKLFRTDMLCLVSPTLGSGT